MGIIMGGSLNLETHFINSEDFFLSCVPEFKENNNEEIVKDVVRNEEEKILVHILFIGLCYKDFRGETNMFFDSVLTGPGLESWQDMNYHLIKDPTVFTEKQQKT